MTPDREDRLRRAGSTDPEVQAAYHAEAMADARRVVAASQPHRKDHTMSTYTVRDRLHVTRVADTPHSSHIEPPLDTSWPRWKQLSWKAAVIAADTGLQVTVVHYSGYLTLHRWQLEVGSHVLPDRTFRQAWHEMDGLKLGYQLGKED